MSRVKEKDPLPVTDEQKWPHSSSRTVSNFTDEDHLRLLQLMTRRAMAERQRRAVLRESDDLETAAGIAAPSALVDVLFALALGSGRNFSLLIGSEMHCRSGCLKDVGPLRSLLEVERLFSLSQRPSTWNPPAGRTGAKH